MAGLTLRRSGGGRVRNGIHKKWSGGRGRRERVKDIGLESGKEKEGIC